MGELGGLVGDIISLRAVGSRPPPSMPRNRTTTIPNTRMMTQVKYLRLRKRFRIFINFSLNTLIILDMFDTHQISSFPLHPSLTPTKYVHFLIDRFFKIKDITGQMCISI